jgi:hypothetical protein
LWQIKGDVYTTPRPGEKNFFDFDNVGSTEALLDGSGASTDTYVYEAFGNSWDVRSVSWDSPPCGGFGWNISFEPLDEAGLGDADDVLL